MMMRAEPWRKQSLFKGDSIPQSASPRQYAKNKNFNWNNERRRVVKILGVDAFETIVKI
jgi:hypothetical protein